MIGQGAPCRRRTPFVPPTQIEAGLKMIPTFLQPSVFLMASSSVGLSFQEVSSYHPSPHLYSPFLIPTHFTLPPLAGLLHRLYLIQSVFVLLPLLFLQLLYYN